MHEKLLELSPGDALQRLCTAWITQGLRSSYTVGAVIFACESFSSWVRSFAFGDQ